MAKLPGSLLIALWIVGSTWLVALLAMQFGVSAEVVWAAVIVGTGAGVYEWITNQKGPRA